MLNTYLKNLKQVKFVLIGEIHGVKENVEVLRLIARSYLKSKKNNKLILAFEWPHQLTNEINEYIINDLRRLEWKRWDFIKSNDGRIAKEHMLFLKWLKNFNRNLSKNKKIKIQCFDVVERDWNERDKKMANILLKLKRQKNTQLIAIMGNLHAPKTEFILGDNKFIPLGSHFPMKETMSIRLEYSSGYFYNEHIKKIPLSSNMDIVGRSKLQKTNRPGYDYVFLIKTAHPIRPLH